MAKTARIVDMAAHKISKQGQYVDEILDIDRQMAELQARRDLLQERLSRKGPMTVTGAEAKASVYERTNTWIDPKKVKRALGVAGYAKCLSSSTTLCLRVTKL